MCDGLLHQVAVHFAGEAGDVRTVLGELLLSPSRVPRVAAGASSEG